MSTTENVEPAAENPDLIHRIASLTRMLRDAATLPCPITIVPADISKERLEAIT